MLVMHMQQLTHDRIFLLFKPDLWLLVINTRIMNFQNDTLSFGRQSPHQKNLLPNLLL